MNRFLVVIGAGEGALPILEKAKEINIRTLAFGHADSLAKDYADVFVESDIFDYDYLITVCKHYDVIGIMASSEITTEVAAIIADKLGLPGNDVKNGFAGKNKYVMRTRVAGLSSVKQPAFFLYDAQGVYSFPIVVKSVDSCGKMGMSIAYDYDGLRNAVPIAQRHSSDGTILVEEYLQGGQEYSIECLSNGKGNHYVIQYTEKESAGPPHFVEVAHHQPATLSEVMKARINNAVNDILEVLGLNYGMAHLELKIINDELYFIEVGARGGGDHISDILTPLSTGFDYYKAAIECSTGDYCHQAIKTKAYTGLYYHCKQNERLKVLFDSAKTASWCVENTVKKDDFDTVTCNTEAMASGYIIYCADHKITKDDCRSF